MNANQELDFNATKWLNINNHGCKPMVRYRRILSHEVVERLKKGSTPFGAVKMRFISNHGLTPMVIQITPFQGFKYI